MMKIESENLPIGLFEDLSRTCSMLEIPFTRGDRLTLYTDGVTESINREGRMLGVEGLEQYLKACIHLPADACAQTVIRAVSNFREGAAATDDQLLLTIAYLDPHASSGPRPVTRTVASTRNRLSPTIAPFRR